MCGTDCRDRVTVDQLRLLGRWVVVSVRPTWDQTPPPPTICGDFPSEDEARSHRSDLARWGPGDGSLRYLVLGPVESDFRRPRRRRRPPPPAPPSRTTCPPPRTGAAPADLLNSPDQAGSIG